MRTLHISIVTIISICPLVTAATQPEKPVAANRPVSVFVVDVKGDGLRFTGSAEGVLFDLHATGKPVRTAWTAAESDDAFLVLDINLNRRIDDGSEMAGDGLKAQDGQRVSNAIRGLYVLQGFAPELVLDPPRGAGSIDQEDDVFPRLRLWTDLNHDGRSDPNELRTLQDQGVRAVPLSFGEKLKPPVDEHGNKTLLDGFVDMSRGGVRNEHQLNLITLMH